MTSPVSLDFFPEMTANSLKTSLHLALSSRCSATCLNRCWKYNNLLSLALFLFCSDGTVNGEDDIVDKSDPVYRERLIRIQRTDVQIGLWSCIRTFDTNIDKVKY